MIRLPRRRSSTTRFPFVAPIGTSTERRKNGLASRSTASVESGRLSRVRSVRLRPLARGDHRYGTPRPCCAALAVYVAKSGALDRPGNGGGEPLDCGLVALEPLRHHDMDHA